MKFCWLGLCVVLVGCGEVAKLQEARAAEARVEDFVDLQDRIGLLAPTAFTAMPTTGSARFDGGANVVITPSNGSSAINILGDATLTAQFGQGRVTGAVTRMRGASGTTQSNAKLFDVGGRIQIGSDESQIGAGNGLTRPNDWRADFRGNLTTPERGDWRVDGVLEGQFRGTDPGATNPIRGIDGRAVSGTAIRNGSTNTLSLDITAQRR